MVSTSYMLYQWAVAELLAVVVLLSGESEGLIVAVLRMVYNTE